MKGITPIGGVVSHDHTQNHYLGQCKVVCNCVRVTNPLFIAEKIIVN